MFTKYFWDIEFLLFFHTTLSRDYCTKNREIKVFTCILCAQGPKGTAHQDMQIKKKGSGGVFSTNCKSKIMDK